MTEKHLRILGAIGLVGASLTAAGAIEKTSAQESTEPQTLYINLPDWDCNQENFVGQVDRGVIAYTRPDTSISGDKIVITYPRIDRDDNRFYQTVIYEDPGVKSGDILRYYSNSNACPLPDKAQTLEDLNP